MNTLLHLRVFHGESYPKVVSAVSVLCLMQCC